MIEYYQSIMKNDVWEIFSISERNSLMTLKWIYKINHAMDGGIKKHKEKFMERRFSQKEGIDYEETFAPI